MAFFIDFLSSCCLRVQSNLHPTKLKARNIFDQQLSIFLFPSDPASTFFKTFFTPLHFLRNLFPSGRHSLSSTLATHYPRSQRKGKRWSYNLNHENTHWLVGIFAAPSSPRFLRSLQGRFSCLNQYLECEFSSGHIFIINNSLLGLRPPPWSKI